MLNVMVILGLIDCKSKEDNKSVRELEKNISENVEKKMTFDKKFFLTKTYRLKYKTAAEMAFGQSSSFNL